VLSRDERYYTRPVAIDVEVQRLQLGDVILVDVPEENAIVEAKVVRGITRTVDTVRATLRVEGRDDFVKQWPLDELVTVVRGP
jgi:hypothetical protein